MYGLRPFSLKILIACNASFNPMGLPMIVSLYFLETVSKPICIVVPCTYLPSIEETFSSIRQAFTFSMKILVSPL